MTKRLVDIDDKLLERARAAARTPTLKATVEAGLKRLADDELVLRHIRRLRASRALSLERLQAARTPRIRSNG